MWSGLSSGPLDGRRCVVGRDEQRVALEALRVERTEQRVVGREARLLSGRDRSAFPNFQTNLGTSEGEFGVFAAFVAASGLATDQPSAARACPTRAWRFGYLSSDWRS